MLEPVANLLPVRVVAHQVASAQLGQVAAQPFEPNSRIAGGEIIYSLTALTARL